MNLSVKFTKTLTKLLKERHKTQTELSKVLGLNSQNVSMYCNGKTQPDLQNLLKIAEFLNVTTDELLTGLKPENKQTRIDLGLKDESIENIKHINETSEKAMYFLNEFLSDKKLNSTLLKIRNLYEQIIQNPSILKNFVNETPNELTSYMEYKLLNIISEFFLQHIRELAREKYETGKKRAELIVQSLNS